ncbi:MAG: TolB family protein, partial [Chloroflexia bacterium]
ALGTIWYPYFPSPDARPVLKAVLVDGEGRRWGELQQVVDLGLSTPGHPGSISVYSLHISPDGCSFVADVAYGEESRSFWINPTSGELKPVSTDPEHEDFLAWGPDGQVFAGNRFAEVWLENLETREHRVFIFPRTEFGYLAVDALSASPDGMLLADACVYPATVSHPESNIEIGLQPLKEEGKRSIIAAWNAPGWVSIGWLAWSPDGKNLALHAATGMYGSPDIDWQLWLIQKDGGPPTLLTHDIHGPSSWSPDGRFIAFVRRTTYERPAPADLWLFDLATSTEIQLTRFDDRRYVTSLAWSPDGQRLAFAVTVEIGDSVEGYDKIGDYGEIWVTSLDGKEQYPVAGPTAPDAPVAWLPAAKGGQK